MIYLNKIFFNIALISTIITLIGCEETLDETINIPNGIIVSTSTTRPVNQFILNSNGICEKTIFEENMFRIEDTFVLNDNTKNVASRIWTFNGPFFREGNILHDLKFIDEEGNTSDIIVGQEYTETSLKIVVNAKHNPNALDEGDFIGGDNIPNLAALRVTFNDNKQDYREIPFRISSNKFTPCTQEQIEQL